MTRTAWLAALTVALSAAPATGVQNARGADPAPIITTPDQLRWSSVAGMPGLSEAWLVGQSGKPGFYVVRRSFKLGGQVPPRVDAQTIFLTVLSGDVYVGTDDQIDPRTARRLPVGTFLIIPGGSPHYLWARYGEAVVQEWGTLPGKPGEPSSTTEPSLLRPSP
ncbi:MAG TPA: cupin domain-containing protein [Alphaproteobacteria bacterium]|nr:cupin domain-containing protein [Alphaproteobacteria bacterium]